MSRLKTISMFRHLAAYAYLYVVDNFLQERYWYGL